MPGFCTHIASKTSQNDRSIAESNPSGLKMGRDGRSPRRTAAAAARSLGSSENGTLRVQVQKNTRASEYTSLSLEVRNVSLSPSRSSGAINRSRPPVSILVCVLVTSCRMRLSPKSQSNGSPLFDISTFPYEKEQVSSSSLKKSWPAQPNADHHE